ncbi:MAG: diguanylate cyclase [Selenomonadaceae bacterium]|nr:diguanylate cyclase [Selenomonadaceae bacterium]
MDINKSIKHKLFFILLIIGAFPFMIVIIFSAFNTISDMEENVKKNGLLMNNVISEHVTDLLENNFYVLRTLALNPIVTQYIKSPSENRRQSVYQLLKDTNALFQDGNHTALTGADGKQLIRTDNSELVNISKRKHFQEAMAGRDFVSDVIVSMSTGVKIVVLEVPIKDKDGNFIGMLQRNFDLYTLQDFVAMQDNEETFIIVMDRKGIAIANSDEILTLSTEHVGDTSYRFILDNITDDAGVIKLTIDNKESLASYSKNKITGWTIITVQPYQYLLDQVYIKIAESVVIGLIMLLIVASTAELLSKKVAKPIIEITHAADEIVSGHSIDKLEISSQDELGKMAAAFNKIRSDRDAYQLESELDKLTKLYNKVTTEKICKLKLQVFNGDEDIDTLSALYVIDLDHFKEVNDTLGHQFGDKVLVEFSKRLRKCFRPNDCVGRFGGDEFVVIIDNLPNTDIIIRKAEHINEVARELTVDGKNAGVTASIGIAIAPQHGTDYDILFKSADQSLYHVKRNGRNNYYFEQ